MSTGVEFFEQIVWPQPTSEWEVLDEDFLTDSAELRFFSVAEDILDSVL
jgi:hypothetical protein